MSLIEPPLTEAPPAPDPEIPSRRRGLAKLLSFFLVVVLLFAAGALYVRSAAQGSGHSVPVSVVIPEGSSTGKIANLLAQKKIIKVAWLFRIVARLDGRSTVLQPGEYRLMTGMSYGAVLDALAKGPAIKIEKLTVPEGKTVREIGAIIAAKTSLSGKRFLAAATSGVHRLPIMPAGSNNLEGLLFPETYLLEEGTTEDQVVQLMLDQFTEVTAGMDFTKSKGLGITPYQAVVVASMVEREAKVPEDRPKIARVIYNRLARKMRLQIDATVQYAILAKTGSYKSRLTFDDYKIDSPYNTYQISALPPAPIANPGAASLDAALNPGTTDAIFYVLCDKRGGHAFARTQEEFDRLKQTCASKR